jgi:arylsulfatase A-like enzyme
MNSKLPNILIFVMDATRARHLSCYGYQRQTTPNLDRLAERGVVYEQCISSASWTLASMATMFTGLYVSQHGTTFNHQFLDPKFTTLAEVLRDQGYKTAIFSAGGWVSQEFGMNRGFEDFYSYVTGGFDEGIPWLRRFSKRKTIVEKVIRRSYRYLFSASRGKLTYEMARDLRGWFARHSQEPRPAFVIAHFGDPHWPWYHHPKFSWADGSYKPPRIFAPDGHKVIAGELKLTDLDLKMMADYYDGEISFMESYIGQVIDSLEKSGQLDNTLVIVTADHGEELMEHGLMGHGFSMYENVIHVPFIVYHRDLFAGGKRISTPVQNVDIFPTLVELAGADRSAVSNNLLGHSLLSLPADPRPFTISEYLAPNLARFLRVVPNFDVTPFKRQLRALRKSASGDKLIWSSDGQRELYNLRQDPLEKHNLAERYPETVAQLTAELDNWLATVGVYEADQLQPELDAAVAQRLKDLGYI